ncbi:unnamed protein product [Malassezia sympodialis ATCC 42132]|uniref:uncharacterized protein n=1 Tax=Malassezia sympodialis (strain ATCC 42132) TaxID=1230383 RepID=UPI0002C28830|nr:uncharacterized protein MSY001_1692 [Malassezia sympodialis ATCC 42132]CCU98986.1 unnamed protein product [Malassezia sympodialis ATCC 42132]|eukprot:XP_018740257.1 uncharacterized protein MSY001_1692 [Malassezia sympodialis ATCC 42132]
MRRGDPLPEDPTPAMWQRMAQLVAGTTATGTLAYFVFLADFGEAEHCFSPVCTIAATSADAASARAWRCRADSAEVFVQLATADNNDPRSLVGTWSSGSGAVLTGQGPNGVREQPLTQTSFYNPMKLESVEFMRNWTTFVETDPVFFPGVKSVYGLQMYKSNGIPVPKMYLQFRPPQMMPTQAIFKQVIGAPDA